MRQLKVGSTVRIKKSSRFYGRDSQYNPRDTDGTVVSLSVTNTEFPIRVKWGKNVTNVYSPEDLELISVGDLGTSSGLTGFLKKIEKEYTHE